MDYGDDQDKDALKNFLKEIGGVQGNSVEKLTVKAKDLSDKDISVTVFA
jgi:hypothetical protein